MSGSRYVVNKTATIDVGDATISANCQIWVEDYDSENAQEVQVYHRVYKSSNFTNYTKARVEFYVNGSLVVNEDVEFGQYHNSEKVRGWTSLGHLRSGTQVSVRSRVHWLASSGTRDCDTGTQYYTVPTFTQNPEPPTNVQATYVSDNQINITWTNNPQTNKPVEGTWLDRQVNDGSYCTSILPNNYMGTSWSDKDALIQTNSRIKYRLKHYNSVGGSANYVYTNYVDTTPAAPQQVVAIQTGTKVSLQATTNNIRYPDHYEWQRATTGSFSDATTLTGTGASLIDTTTINKPWYRVRCVGTGGLKSAWTVCQASQNAQIFVNIPLGATMKAIYIRKP